MHGLTFSVWSMTDRIFVDSASPSLCLLEVRKGVLYQSYTKTLLDPLTGHAGTHPSFLKRVKIGRKISSNVRAIISLKSLAADTVCQVEDHLAPSRRCRCDPLNSEVKLCQIHRIPDLSIVGGREFSVQHNLADPVALG